tara:strand:- start:311 stop:508 length:198 start_codon:yes stop_codon:yes gene_type:complete
MKILLEINGRKVLCTVECSTVKELPGEVIVNFGSNKAELVFKESDVRKMVEQAQAMDSKRTAFTV